MKDFESRRMKVIRIVRNFLVVINIEQSSFLVNSRYNSRPLLKAMLKCLKYYNISLTNSINKVSNRNFNKKLVNERGITKVVMIIS